MNKLYEIDREIFEAIEAEKKRQNEGIELKHLKTLYLKLYLKQLEV